MKLNKTLTLTFSYLLASLTMVTAQNRSPIPDAGPIGSMKWLPLAEIRKQIFIPEKRNGSVPLSLLNRTNSSNKTTSGSRITDIITSDFEFPDSIRRDSIHYTFSGSNGGNWDEKFLPFDNSVQFEFGALKYEIDQALTGGHPTEQILKEWDPIGSEWLNSIRYTNTWSSGRVTEITWADWNGSNWEDFSKTSYSYTAGRLSTITESLWKGSWVNYKMYSYSYSSSLLTEVLVQDWNGTGWVNNYRNVFTYSGTLQTTDKIQEYNQATNSWQNADLIEYTLYDGQLLLESTHSLWNNTSNLYDYESKSTYEYTDFGAPSDVIQKDWNGSTFVTALRSTLSYNAVNQPVLVEYYIPNGASWEKFTNTVYQYESYMKGTNVGSMSTDNRSVTISPNPASNYVIINTPVITGNPVVTIYDVQGRIHPSVLSIEGGLQKLNVSSVPAGLYFVATEIEGVRHINKLEVIK
ncbi:MAG: T9SS type A sorting domain-containing protein [Sphingobacteriales bacterium]|nr:MAG: T9SS type A sorting domain-containing protein [Sphingobacteriales bacterium]